MVPYTASISDIERDFTTSHIPTSAPGFYNHQNFVSREEKNPEYLNNYARFVQSRSYSREYLDHARRIIHAAVQAMYHELVADGRLGACIDASGILSQSLERHGIWNFLVRGSLTITYPNESGLAPQYFHTIDEGDFSAAHAWLFAPPFPIVDVTVSRQRNISRESTYLPTFIVAEAVEPSCATSEDLISPVLRQRFVASGIPVVRQIDELGPHLSRFRRMFPAATTTISGTRFKYIPCSASAPDCTLEDHFGLTRGARRAITIYNESIKPAIRTLEAEQNAGWIGS
jgi:hypothetical protein